MKLLVTFGVHAVEVQGGFYNAAGLMADYRHMQRYREHIPELLIVLRAKKADAADPAWLRIDGEGVDVAPIPDPDTPSKSLLMMPAILLRVLRAIRACDRFYLKLPDATGTVVGLLLCLLRKPYAAEVVADSASGILLAKKEMWFARFYARLFDRLTGLLVRRAQCATYVSHYLRRRYPGRARDREWVFASVELDESFIGSPRSPGSFDPSPLRIISVGRQSPEKGHVHLIRAFKKIHEALSGAAELHMVGQGVEQSRLRAESRTLEIDASVHFHGYIRKGPRLFELFDRSHVFVMPSLTEGMGRALVEAMARGMPCLGSAVGGIPELLEEADLFPPGNPDAMAARILPLAGASERLAAMSLRSFEAAKAWRPDAQRARKQAFWKHVLECGG